MRRWTRKETPSTPPKPIVTPDFGSPPARRIGEMLLEEGIITPNQLEEALAMQAKRGGKTVENLISLGYLSAEDFTRFLARQPGIGSIDLSNYEIPRDLVSLVPREFAIRHEVLPIDRLGKLLTLGMACPLDSKTMGELERMTGLRVKALLCAANDVRRAIERYYGPPEEPLSPAAASVAEETPFAEETVKAPAAPVEPAGVEGLESPIRLCHVASLIRRVDSLPALPETIQRTRMAMANPLSSVSDVANIIVLDPPVAAKILSVANSAAYGFRHRIADITLAVSLLGLRETYGILLSVAVVDLLKISKHFDYKRFWLSSMGSAAAARLVARVASRRDLSGVFAAALLRNIGCVALANVAPELYAHVGTDLSGYALMEAEERVLGVAHPEAGYELAQHWDMPPDIAAAIRFHHRLKLATEYQETVAIVAVAGTLAHLRDAGPASCEMLMHEQQDALALLGIDREGAEALAADYVARRGEAFKNVNL